MLDGDRSRRAHESLKSGGRYAHTECRSSRRSSDNRCRLRARGEIRGHATTVQWPSTQRPPIFTWRSKVRPTSRNVPSCVVGISGRERSTTPPLVSGSSACGPGARKPAIPRVVVDAGRVGYGVPSGSKWQPLRRSPAHGRVGVSPLNREERLAIGERCVRARLEPTHTPRGAQGVA